MRLPANQFFGIYNDTFKHLEARFGKEAVLDIWNMITESYGKVLDDHLTKYGPIEGAYIFWDTAFKNEGLDYEIKKEDDALEIVVHNCVPIAWKKKHNVENYKDYCEHCDALYSPVLRKHGYKVNIVWDIGGVPGECKRRITKFNKYGN
jgi:hypothetical protein